MMTTEISQINPAGVESYLINTGWGAVASKRPDIRLFRIERSDNIFEITLPLNRSFIDYDVAMHLALEKIARFEDRELAEIINILTTPSADIVKFRRADINTEDGTIPFDEGIRLFENAKKTIYTVVCDLLEPKLYHKRLWLKAADAFIERCSFGQTERGSYVATIICPFSDADQIGAENQLSLFDVAPDYSNSFTRQVTAKLMQSLEQVHNAIKNEQLSSIQDVDDPKKVISGNLLEALLDLNGSDSSAEIEISTQWSVNAPLKQSLVPSSVKFVQNDFLPIEVEVERIRGKNEVKSRVGDFIGRVSLIETEPDIEQRTNGEIILNTIDTDGKLIKPRMVVSPDELEVVMQAMKEGLNIRVKGVLKSQGRTKVLEYTSLRIID